MRSTFLAVLTALGVANGSDALAQEWSVWIGGGVASGYEYGPSEEVLGIRVRQQMPKGGALGLAIERTWMDFSAVGLEYKVVGYGRSTSVLDGGALPLDEEVHARVSVMALTAALRYDGREGWSLQAVASPSLVIVNWRAEASRGGTLQSDGRTRDLAPGIGLDAQIERRLVGEWSLRCRGGWLFTSALHGDAVGPIPAGRPGLSVGSVTGAIGRRWGRPATPRARSLP